MMFNVTVNPLVQQMTKLVLVFAAMLVIFAVCPVLVSEILCYPFFFSADLRVTLQVPHVELELLIIPEHMSSPPSF